MKPIPFGFRQIAQLLAVAETGSTAAAARTLNVSQPTVSQALAKFEAYFGQPLFLRLPGQGMQTTPFGRQKIEALAALMAHGRAVMAASGPAGWELVLGVFSTLGPRYAPRIVRAFRLRYPQAHVQLVEGDIEAMVQGLRRGRLDLALLYDVGLPDDLALHPLESVAPHALVASGNPLAGQTSVSLKLLAEHPLILINLPHSRDYFLSLFRHVGCQPRITTETGSVEMLRAMVGNDMGVGLLATDLPYDRTYDGSRVVRLALTEAVPPSRVALARQAALMPNPAANALLELAPEAITNRAQIAAG